MKIAIASNSNMCSDHFGHCEGFQVYEIENNKIKEKFFIKNPGHKPGFLPVYLNEKGINVIIAGGMGEMAQQLFNENNIKVIVGITGENEKIITQYIENELSSDKSICDKHEYEGDCGE